MASGFTLQRSRAVLDRDLSDEETAKIVADHSSSAKIQAIARKHQVTPKRVRAIWEAAGLPRRNRGSM